MKPSGIHHVAINVADVDAAVEFYTQVLGLAPIERPGGRSRSGAWLAAGGQQVHLRASDVPPELGQHLALHVENLDVVVRELRQRGVDVTDPAPIGTGRQSFVFDPSGNRIELHQPVG